MSFYPPKMPFTVETEYFWFLLYIYKKRVQRKQIVIQLYIGIFYFCFVIIFLWAKQSTKNAEKITVLDILKKNMFFF